MDDLSAAFEKVVKEFEQAGSAHGPAFLGAAIVTRLDLLLNETKAVQKALQNLAQQK
jgi:hypothetical protein